MAEFPVQKTLRPRKILQKLHHGGGCKGAVASKIPNLKLQFLSSSVSGEILGITGQDPSVSKSNHLHVDIFRFFLYLSQVYSIDSSRMMGNFPDVFNFNRLFLKLNRFICNKHSAFPVH